MTQVGLSRQLHHSIQTATQIASELGHGDVLPEHIMLALLADEEVSFLLEAYDVDFEAAKDALIQHLVKIPPQGSERQHPTAHLSKDVENLLVIATVGAHQSGFDETDSIMVLAILLSEENSTSADIMRAHELGHTGVLRYLELRSAGPIQIMAFDRTRPDGIKVDKDTPNPGPTPQQLQRHTNGGAGAHAPKAQANPVGARQTVAPKDNGPRARLPETQSLKGEIPRSNQARKEEHPHKHVSTEAAHDPGKAVQADIAARPIQTSAVTAPLIAKVSKSADEALAPFSIGKPSSAGSSRAASDHSVPAMQQSLVQPIPSTSVRASDTLPSAADAQTITTTKPNGNDDATTKTAQIGQNNTQLSSKKISRTPQVEVKTSNLPRQAGKLAATKQDTATKAQFEKSGNAATDQPKPNGTSGNGLSTSAEPGHVTSERQKQQPELEVRETTKTITRDTTPVAGRPVQIPGTRRPGEGRTSPANAVNRGPAVSGPQVKRQPQTHSTTITPQKNGLAHRSAPGQAIQSAQQTTSPQPMLNGQDQTTPQALAGGPEATKAPLTQQQGVSSLAAQSPNQGVVDASSRVPINSGNEAGNFPPSNA